MKLNYTTKFIPSDAIYISSQTGLRVKVVDQFMLIVSYFTGIITARKQAHIRYPQTYKPLKYAIHIVQCSEYHRMTPTAAQA